MDGRGARAFGIVRTNAVFARLFALQRMEGRMQMFPPQGRHVRCVDGDAGVPIGSARGGAE
jgi:hypothetical protein